MPNAITDPPNDYPFGLEFNYGLWTQGTTVTLVNVPWNNDYRDIVKFPGETKEERKGALNAYINSIDNQGIEIINLSYVKPNQPIRIDVPFNTAYKYNYIRASNPFQSISNDTAKDFYYFITDVRYIAPNTTEVVIQIDVWQTFGYDIEFGNSYIERGHIGIANEKAFDNYGRDYLTIPEGLDVGGEYVTISRRDEYIGGPANLDILVVSTVALEEDLGSNLEPKLETAKGDDIQRLPSGANYYVFNDVASFRYFMQQYARYPWATQGIISITQIPDVTRYGYTRELVGEFNGVNLHRVEYQNPDTPERTGGKYFNMFVNWRESNEIKNNIPERYRHLRKFFTFPYMAIEMTAFTGQPVILKPESWANPHARMSEKAVLAPPNQRIVFYPTRYNAKPNSPIRSTKEPFNDTTDVIATDRDYYDDGGEYLDKATSINNFPKFALVNNMALGVLAAQSNSIAFQERSADWAQQRALRGNEVSYDQASSGMNLANELTGIGTGADAAQTSIGNQGVYNNAITGGIGGLLGGGASGAIGGAMAGGPPGAIVGAGVGIVGGGVGAIMGGVSAVLQVGQNDASLAVRNAAANAANAAQVGNQGFVRDTNKNLADWAAKGDYENNIAGINAKVQDIALTQPSTSGQVGGEAFNIVHEELRFSLRWRLVDQSAIRTVGEYWLRYGYAVRQFGRIPESLLVMSKFTYWKLSETYLIAAGMPETFKQSIRGIFEKGVTVWASPDYIGNIDIADNTPLEGVTL